MKRKIKALLLVAFIGVWILSSNYRIPIFATELSSELGSTETISESGTEIPSGEQASTEHISTEQPSTETPATEQPSTELPAESTQEPELTPEEFEAELRLSGFPDSYIGALMALHETYPRWKFEAVKTGLDWATVIEYESTNGKNLVQTSADDAKKSVAEGAYDWLTNTWTIYDGSSWVSAHPDYIAYCMDPRNFLNEENIFQFESLSYNEHQTIEGVRAILNNTFMASDIMDTDGSVLNYADAFMGIAALTGVSPYHLASRVKQEQGIGGTSPLISGTYSKYEGLFNYFNFGAYGSTKTVVIESGLKYARTQGWTSRLLSLYGGAALLGTNYIARGQDTLYFQKFNVVYQPALFGHQYMGNVGAAISEGLSVAAAYSDKNQAFTFRIPVYEQMPEQPVAFLGKGNPNNYLKSLTVDGDLTLTPSFQPTTTGYSMVVENSVSSITISAVAVSSKARVTGTGTFELAVGNNTFVVTCMAENGETKEYVLTIARAQPPVVVYEAASDVYAFLDNSVIGIAPGTEVNQFLEAIRVTAGHPNVVNSKMETVVGSLATGNILGIYADDGEPKLGYWICIYGDLNEDGSIDALDMIKLNRYILGLESLQEPYLSAADANRRNDGVNALDMIAINRHILGLSTINQS